MFGLNAHLFHSIDVILANLDIAKTPSISGSLLHLASLSSTVSAVCQRAPDYHLICFSAGGLSEEDGFVSFGLQEFASVLEDPWGTRAGSPPSITTLRS